MTSSSIGFTRYGSFSREPRPKKKRTLTGSHVSPPPAAQTTGVRYPVVVRFVKENYAGVNTNNYALDEIESA